MAKATAKSSGGGKLSLQTKVGPGSFKQPVWVWGIVALGGYYLYRRATEPATTGAEAPGTDSGDYYGSYDLGAGGGGYYGGGGYGGYGPGGPSDDTNPPPENGGGGGGGGDDGGGGGGGGGGGCRPPAKGCGRGYRWHKGQCRCVRVAGHGGPGHGGGGHGRTCPKGYHWNGVRCVQVRNRRHHRNPKGGGRR